MHVVGVAMHVVGVALHADDYGGWLNCVQVKLSWKSMNHGDAFILDMGLTIYTWLGSGVGRMEKIKAGEVARRIKDEERGGRAQIKIQGVYVVMENCDQGV